MGPVLKAQGGHCGGKNLSPGRLRARPRTSLFPAVLEQRDSTNWFGTFGVARAPAYRSAAGHPRRARVAGHDAVQAMRSGLVRIWTRTVPVAQSASSQRELRPCFARLSRVSDPAGSVGIRRRSGSVTTRAMSVKARLRSGASVIDTRRSRGERYRRNQRVRFERAVRIVIANHVREQVGPRTADQAAPPRARGRCRHRHLSALTAINGLCCVSHRRGCDGLPSTSTLFL